MASEADNSNDAPVGCTADNKSQHDVPVGDTADTISQSDCPRLDFDLPQKLLTERVQIFVKEAQKELLQTVGNGQ